MPTVWRLVKTKYSKHPFDGEGARLHGGRWSSPGTVVAYGSESAALAVLEVLVHVQSAATLRAFSLATAVVPDDVVEVLDPELLPESWKRSPPSADCQAVGDAWVRAGSSAVLRVPSVILDGSSNYLMSPAHPAFGAITVRASLPFDFDERLARQ